jgi:ATP-binding cassette, subfamily B, bacterial
MNEMKDKVISPPKRKGIRLKLQTGTHGKTVQVKSVGGVWNFSRYLFDKVFKYRKKSFTVIFTILVGVAYMVMLPLSYKLLFDRVIPEGNIELLILTLLGIGGIFILNAVSRVLEDHIVASLAAKVLKEQRGEVFNQLQLQSDIYFHIYNSGDLLSRFESDIGALERILIRTAPELLSKIALVVVGMITLYILDWRLAFLATVLLPCSLWFSMKLRSRALKYNYEKRQVESNLSQLIHENIGMQRIIKIFRLERFMELRFGKEQHNLEHASYKANFHGALTWRVTDLGVGFTQIVVMGFGAGLAVMGYLSIGSLVAFFTLLLGVSGAVSGLAGFMPELIRGEVSWRRLEEILHCPADIIELPNAQELPRHKKSISFEQIVFGYGHNKAVLHGAGFSIEKGQSIALVGPSGAGKSTFLKLLLRIYDPWMGKITMDGVSIDECTIGSLRDQIGLVPQDTALFNTTIMENIRFGNLHARDEEVIQAAKDAHLHRYIIEMDKGYETVIRDMGKTLSGGQRQRIAIARVFLRNPEIVLLDEATSALDPETEVSINKNILNMGKGKTIIAVTHRLTSVINYNRIIVIDKGKVVEEGTHGELLKIEGVYFELWQKQTGVTLSLDGKKASVHVEYLQQINWLQELDEFFLQQLALEFDTERFVEEQIIFDEGEAGDKFYILVRGIISVEVSDNSNKLHEVATLNDGDWFGEIALLKDIPRTARVRCHTPCTCLALSRIRFFSLLKHFPYLEKTFGDEVKIRLNELNLKKRKNRYTKL